MLRASARKLVLIFQYFQSANPCRQEEIDYCLRKNVQCSEISEWIIFLDNKEPPDLRSLNLADGKRVEYRPLGRRLEYRDFLLSATDPQAVYILINSDIELAGGIQHFRHVGSSELWAISRWKDNSGPRPLARESQDTWAVRGRKTGWPDSELEPFRIRLGMPGCENAFAGRLKALGWKVRNFCYDIKTLHHHKSGYRTYTDSDRLPRPYYLPDPERLPFWRKW